MVAKAEAGPTAFNEAILRAIEARGKVGYGIGRTVKTHTIEDLISAVLSITDELEMRQFYDGYLDYLIGLVGSTREPRTRDEADRIARHNIGWCFGEGMPEARRKRWNKVTGATHPVFGVLQPTAEEAYEAGYQMGLDSLRAVKKGMRG